MSRLPIVGQDEDIWGEILNDVLCLEHNDDGTLTRADKINSAVQAVNGKGGPSVTITAGDVGAATDSSVIHKAGNETVTGTKTFSASPIVPDPSSSTQAANKNYVDSVVAGGAADATATSKGVVQLAGDLAGTASAPTVPGLSTKEPTIATGTASQYYRGDKTWQTLDKASISLGNVDNTSDANKPVSTATQTALNAKADKSTLTSKGDLYVATAASTITRLGAGNDGEVLTVDSSQTAGLKWSAGASGYIQGDGIVKITVGSTQPTTPQVGDIWVNT
jgi:hypothetical protein